MGRLTTIHLSLIFGVFKCLPLISLVDEIQFILISSRHICIRSSEQYKTRVLTGLKLWQLHDTRAFE